MRRLLRVELAYSTLAYVLMQVDGNGGEGKRRMRLHIRAHHRLLSLSLFIFILKSMIGLPIVRALSLCYLVMHFPFVSGHLTIQKCFYA